MGLFGFRRKQKPSAPSYTLVPLESIPFCSPGTKVFIDGERALLTTIYARIVGRVWATWKRFDPETLPPLQEPSHISDAELSAFALVRHAILADQGVGGVIAPDQLPNLHDHELADWVIRMLAEAKKRENRMASWVPSFRSLVFRMGDWAPAKNFHKFAEVWTLEGKRTMAGMCEPAAPVRGTGQYFRKFPAKKDGPLGRAYSTPPPEETSVIIKTADTPRYARAKVVSRPASLAKIDKDRRAEDKAALGLEKAIAASRRKRKARAKKK